MMKTLNLTREALEAEVQGRAPWYHSIDLGLGVITPGTLLSTISGTTYDSSEIASITSKNVFSTLPAMTACGPSKQSALGAAEVVATDITYHAFEHFMFCKQVLGSNVVPYYNVSPYNLAERLDVRFGALHSDFGDAAITNTPEDRAFDVVHHLGLLYHVRDPLATLSQARSVMKKGGFLLIETGVVLNIELSCMVFNGVDPDNFRIYDDPTTWWAPTILCLHEMLRASLFEPLLETQVILPQGKRETDTGRVCLAARAVDWQDAPHGVAVELANVHRNPGLEQWFTYHAGDLGLLSKSGLLEPVRKFLKNKVLRK